MPESHPDYDDDVGHDLTSAALAAVARSRSPTSISGGGGSGNGKGKRAALPREFMGRDRRSLDGRSTGSNEPQTPHRQPNRENTNVYIARGSPEPRSSASTFSSASQQPPLSPRGPRSTRSSTVRELTRRHQTRWLSEDLNGDPDADEDIHGNGRRQSIRGGSAESPLGGLPGGRSLVGEGLRAAGIKTKKGDDVFGSGGAGKVFDERSQTSGSGSSRVSEGVGPPSVALAKVQIVDPRSSNDSERRANRASYNGLSSRPATSMADYHQHGEDAHPPGAAPPVLRSYKSAYTLPERDRDRQGIGASIHARQPSQPAQTISQDRTFSPSPFATRRHTSMTPLPPGSGSTPAPGHQYSTSSEHGRLMLESLQMFESHLTRLPNMGTTTTQTIPDLFRAAQNIVQASDKLNGLLRAGTNGALEEQIDAEVGNNEGASGGEEVAEVWRRVGGEMRESLRISDEVVRTMTGFLLGVGKVLKETAAAAGDGSHSRNGSLDEEGSRRNASPDVEPTNGSGRRSVDGRLSVNSRRSWEPSPRNSSEGTVARRLSVRPEPRPSSSLNTAQNGNGEVGEREPAHTGPSRNGSTLSGTVRRLFTPRDKREQQLNSSMGRGSANVSLDISNGHDPSPTPATRQNQGTLGRARTLPPISMPPPLPSLPSESILRRRGSNAGDKGSRRKPSTASATTVRASNPMAPSVSTPTTAVTTGDGNPFPITRNDSTESTRNTNVTFSRPSTISVSALNGLRKRTISTTSSNAEEVSTSVPQVVSPLSGSETERDTRRKTIGGRAGMRMSLDSAANRDREPVIRAQPQQSMAPSAMRKERRRTVTEIFS